MTLGFKTTQDYGKEGRKECLQEIWNFFLRVHKALRPSTRNGEFTFILSLISYTNSGKLFPLVSHVMLGNCDLLSDCQWLQTVGWCCSFTCPMLVLLISVIYPVCEARNVLFWHSKCLFFFWRLNTQTAVMTAYVQLPIQLWSFPKECCLLCW